MRRAVITVLFVLAWMVGPVARIADEPVAPQPVLDAPRGAHP
jgi:hypothetical protein